MPGIDDLDKGDRAALIVMPGTGSDADYLRRSFGPAAVRLGLDLVALQPSDDLVAAHLRALDDHAEQYGRFIVGGVSIGAAIALEWALETRHPCCRGVWAALPAWSGAADDAPAAWSARAGADALDTDGLESTIAAMAASSPPWLADELSRSWRALHPGLSAQLRCAGAYRAPTPQEISLLSVPLAVVAAVDDPIHPLEVARQWCAAAPRSGCREFTLAEWGSRPTLLGDACAEIWTALRSPDDDQRRRI